MPFFFVSHVVYVEKFPYLCSLKKQNAMEEEKTLRYMMFVVVLSKFNDTQKMMHCAKAVGRYGWNIHGSNVNTDQKEAYNEWAMYGEHAITVLGVDTFGEMDKMLNDLHMLAKDVFFARDADFGDRVVSFAFIADERVFDDEKYPGFGEYLLRWKRRCDESDIVLDSNGNDTGMRLAIGHIPPTEERWKKSVFGDDSSEIGNLLKIRNIINSKTKII